MNIKNLGKGLLGLGLIASSFFLGFFGGKSLHKKGLKKEEERKIKEIEEIKTEIIKEEHEDV